MAAPKRASEVELDPAALGKDEASIRREKAAKAARSRQTRSEALRLTGALDDTVSTDPTRRMEARLKSIQDKAARSFKTKQAVREKMGNG